MIDVVILGAGGFARELYWVFLEDNEQQKRWNVLGFVDDKPELQGAVICGIPVLGTMEWLERNRRKNVQLISSAGDPHTRKALAERGAALDFDFCTVVHPSARMSRWVELGPGTVNSTIGLDCVIGAYANINPGSQISGAVKFGEGVYFGTGAVIIQGKSVGEWSVIGAGAVVTSNIPAHVTAVGVPCRVIKEHQFEQSFSIRA